jgi:hypothetical protein
MLSRVETGEAYVNGFPQFWMTPRVSLDGEEYAKALGAAAALGVVGGGIYDAMLAHCALKAQAETIYSWNARHYA